MSTDRSSSSAQRTQIAEEKVGEIDQGDREAVYYATLAARLDGLLAEIDASGHAPDDELVMRLRALHEEVQRLIELKR